MVILISLLKPRYLMDLNPLKQRKTILYFKKLFIMVEVYLYDNFITKKTTLVNFVFPEGSSLKAWAIKLKGFS